MIRALLSVTIILTAISFEGCGIRNRFSEFKSEAEARVEPEKLRQWAISVLETNDIGKSIAVEEIPKNVRFGNGPTSVDVYKFAGASEKALLLNWGSGFGHWGVIAGGTNLVSPSSSTTKLELWRPGIYFYYQTK
jgi:hypothetical protein